MSRSTPGARVALALALTLLLPLAVGPGCAPAPLVLTRPARPVHGLPADPDAARRRYTRSVVPAELELRWIEATLVDPAWVAVEQADRARRLGASPEQQAADERAALTALGWGEGVALQLWTVLQCQPCTALSAWRWELVDARGGAPRLPLRVDSTIVRTEQQTLTVLDVSRVIPVFTVRGLLIFPGTAGPGTLTLRGQPPGEGLEPQTFQWEIAPP